MIKYNKGVFFEIEEILLEDIHSRLDKLQNKMNHILMEL